MPTPERTVGAIVTLTEVKCISCTHSRKMENRGSLLQAGALPPTLQPGHHDSHAAGVCGFLPGNLFSWTPLFSHFPRLAEKRRDLTIFCVF